MSIPTRITMYQFQQPIQGVQIESACCHLETTAQCASVSSPRLPASRSPPLFINYPSITIPPPCYSHLLLPSNRASHYFSILLSPCISPITTQLPHHLPSPTNHIPPIHTNARFFSPSPRPWYAHLLHVVSPRLPASDCVNEPLSSTLSP